MLYNLNNQININYSANTNYVWKLHTWVSLFIYG